MYRCTRRSFDAKIAQKGSRGTRPAWLFGYS